MHCPKCPTCNREKTVAVLFRRWGECQHMIGVFATPEKAREIAQRLRDQADPPPPWDAYTVVVELVLT